MAFPQKIIGYLISLCWLVFFAYWFYKATRVKKDTLKEHAPGPRIFIALLFIAIVWLVATDVREVPLIPYTKVSQIAGLILCAFGVGWTIWARKVLDSNWSASPNIKENHELVRTGPYKITRHPIYTGSIVAWAGTFFAVMATWLGLGMFLFGVVAFIFRVPKEEKYMTQTFPADYPAYKQKVRWALFPYIY